MGKFSSNPVEQANLGILSIHEFGPLKLLIEIWYYILAKFNERRVEAFAWKIVLIDPAHRAHLTNLRTFGQWQVLDDGHTQAKVQMTDQWHEYLVDILEKL